MCPGMVFTQVDLDNHLEKHELVNPSDRQERDDSLERRRSGKMDQKVTVKCSAFYTTLFCSLVRLSSFLVNIFF